MAARSQCDAYCGMAHTKASPKRRPRRLQNWIKRNDTTSLLDEKCKTTRELIGIFTFLTQKNVRCVRTVLLLSVVSSSHSHSHCILRFLLIYTWHSSALLPVLRCAYQNATMKWYTFDEFFDRKLDKISRNTKFHFILVLQNTQKKAYVIHFWITHGCAAWSLIDQWVLVISLSEIFEWEHLAVRTHLFRHCSPFRARACVLSERPTRTNWIARKQKSLLFSVLLALAFTASFAHSHTHTNQPFTFFLNITLRTVTNSPNVRIEYVR